MTRLKSRGDFVASRDQCEAPAGTITMNPNDIGSAILGGGSEDRIAPLVPLKHFCGQNI